MIDGYTRLIADLNRIDGLERVTSLLILRDEIEYGDWSQAKVRAVLARLLNAVFAHDASLMSANSDLQHALHDLFLRQVDYPLSEADLEPIFTSLRGRAERETVCLALSLLSYTFDRKFLATIRDFLSHSDPTIAAAAERALNRIHSRPALWQLFTLDHDRVAQLGEAGELAMVLLEAMPAFESSLLQLLYHEELPDTVRMIQTLADSIAEQSDDNKLEQLPGIFACIERLLIEGRPVWQSALTEVFFDVLQRHLLPREHWEHLVGPRSRAYVRPEDDFIDYSQMGKI